MGITRDGSPFRKIIKGLFVVAGGNFAIYFFAFVYQIFISRTLGPEGFGLYGLVNSIYITFSQISTLGLGYALIYYLASDSGTSSCKKVKYKKEELFKTIVVIWSGFAVIISGIMALSGLTWLGGLYKIAGFRRLLLIMSPAVVLWSGLIFFESAFRGFEDAVSAYKVKVFPECLKFVLIPALLFFLSRDVASLLILIVIIEFVAILYGIYLLNKSGISLSSVVRASFIPLRQCGKMLLYSAPFFLKDIVQILRERADTFLVAYLMSGYHLGIYRAAYVGASALSFIPMGMGYMLFPVLSRLNSNNNDGDESEFSLVAARALKYMIYAGSLGVVFVVLFSSDILRVVFGSGYTLGVKTFILMAITQFATIFYVIPGILLAVKEKTNFIFYAEFISFITGLAMSITLIPRYGITGAALAGLCGVMTLTVVMNIVVYFLCREFIFSWSSSGVIPVVILVASIMFFSKADSLFLVRIAVFVVVVLFLIFWIIIFEKNEIISVGNFLVDKYGAAMPPAVRSIIIKICRRI